MSLLATIVDGGESVQEIVAGKVGHHRASVSRREVEGRGAIY